MSIEFHVDSHAGTARAGRLVTPHGEIETPVFMPVGTVATVKAVPQDVLEELGVEILITSICALGSKPSAASAACTVLWHGRERSSPIPGASRSSA